MESTLMTMDIGSLLSIFLQSFVVQFLIYILSALIFVIVYLSGDVTDRTYWNGVIQNVCFDAVVDAVTRSVA